MSVETPIAHNILGFVQSLYWRRNIVVLDLLLILF